MTIYLSSRTGAAIDSLLDDVNDSNVNKTTLPNTTSDLDNIFATGFYRVDSSAPNTPSGVYGTMVVQGRDNAVTCTQTYINGSGDEMYFRRLTGGSWAAWQELYHTGNTGSVAFGKTFAETPDESVGISVSGLGIMHFKTAVNTLREAYRFTNGNGTVGQITTSGTATAYNTSSDPRLKEFKALPSDELINVEFDNLFSCFRIFNWKNDLEGDLVWGFDAHECVDNNTGIGSEGEGSRNMQLGEVYKTTPAVFEDQEIQLVYKSGDKIGQPRFDSEGEPIMETVSVEVTAAIEHKVSPAGVDQSKAVPILLAKIEQLERRLAILES